ncbi:MAG TPA: prepilin-type cleavage/methylation domain-containing protein [Thermodesulfobacteriota bacterium]|nr:prepilin-type cleavage/methylation domain-containing protein [Thermodesulfobacteriota bacterium]
MRFIDFTDALLTEGRSQKHVRALTMVELILAVAIIGVLGAIAVPVYDGYIDNARNSAAVAGIREIEGKIASFMAERGNPPDTLDEGGIPTELDPWGRPYQYLRLQGVDKKDLHGAWRRDRFTNPLNTDFDLYSMGKDGASKPPLTNPVSHDDIVRANNGAFIGLASDY